MKNKRKTLFDRNLAIIKKKILQKKVYKYREITGILNSLKENSQISQATTSQSFFTQLQENLSLKTHIVVSDKINQERYSLSDITAYDFVDSLVKNTFFSMTTALNLQGLSDFKGDFIFYSQELKERKRVSIKLTQSLIDNAYKKKYSYTHSTAKYGEHYIVFLTPKFSDQTEVIAYKNLKISSIHRSLVEILINIQYFKDFETVIDNFKPLKNNLNVDKVYSVVEKFDLIYPYFQLLGFALSQIGFKNSELDLFKEKISQFNFYTQKNKKNYAYDKFWKIYY
ncbi:hypothetical protein BPUTSESOX_178 [uncultured Gammaproteobacteria bacterium]|jgi:hypothetical protein|nr:hypothetical protein [uncultured Gammaproteobacteria bacterium]CAC9652893.1 hypothetical protein [uncultured Gammaproteobacteria bacterium]VVH51352.1 hypothetical protein BPUTSESOX_178 [uncultured Gammaproteobacteria bacterium]